MKKGTFTRWKKPIAALLGMALVLGTVCGAGNTLPESVRDALSEGVREVLAPVTVQAADTDPAMVEGTEVLRTKAGQEGAQRVWFGTDSNGNTRDWWVIAYDGKDGDGKAITYNPGSGDVNLHTAGAVTLLQHVIEEQAAFHNQSYPLQGSNVYANSDLKKHIDSWLLVGPRARFTPKEKAAILPKTLTGGSNNYTTLGYNANHVKGAEVDDAHLWPLSVAEADMVPVSIGEVGRDWWLRSPGHLDENAAAVISNGDVLIHGYNVIADIGIRPAFDLNLLSVLFTSAAAGGKSCSAEGAANALTSVGKNSGDEWKLTLKDKSYQPSFSVSINGTSNVNAGENISLDYSGAGTNQNDYVSAIIMDGTNILYYGRFAKAKDADTNAVLTIPSGLATGNYTLKVFAEQYNGDQKTDYANNVFVFNITVTTLSGSAPASTSGASETCATGHATYHWITVRAADEHNDGEMVYLCSSCGHELYRVPISGYIVFNKNTMQKILDAPQGATISVSTRRWISFHRMVYQALADRPDVTLKISFLDGGYRGNRYSVTIPAGYDTLSLLNGTDYCGFLYLGSKFGLSPGE